MTPFLIYISIVIDNHLINKHVRPSCNLSHLIKIAAQWLGRDANVEFTILCSARSLSSSRASAEHPGFPLKCRQSRAVDSEENEVHSMISTMPFSSMQLLLKFIPRIHWFVWINLQIPLLPTELYLLRDKFRSNRPVLVTPSLYTCCCSRGRWRSRSCWRPWLDLSG